MIQVAISPSTLLNEGICVEDIEGLRLFKFTEALQAKLEELLEKTNWTPYLQKKQTNSTASMS